MPKATNVVYVHSGPVQESNKVDVLTFNERKIDPLLFRLLSTKSPSGKEQFISTIVTKAIKDFCPDSPKPRIDTEGNIIFELGERGKDHNTMFSCHLDTVHSTDGPLTLVTTNGKYKDGEGYVYGATREKGGKLKAEILGADDRAGIWIMLQMIRKKTPGLYIFHTREERGGVGSLHIVDKTPEVVKDIKRCIAFDRRGYDDIIGRQRGSICCSDDFGKALASALNINMPPKQQYKHGAIGTFTDSANYTSVIPECTNISVGYFDQHMTCEYLDYVFLCKILMPAIHAMKWEMLPTTRDPKVSDAYHNIRTWERPHSNSAYSYTPKKQTDLTISDFYGADGKLLDHAAVYPKLEEWFKNWANTDTFKAWSIIQLVKALDKRIVSVTAEEEPTEESTETPPPKTSVPISVSHGTLMTKEIAQIDRLLAGVKACIELFQDMEQFASVPDDVNVIYSNVIEPSVNTLRVLTNSYNEKKEPAEKVLRASVETVLGFLILCGKIHNKTAEHAEVIEEQIELLTGFIQEKWIGKTNLPKYAGIKESDVIFGGDGETATYIKSPCVRKCTVSKIGGCRGCGRTAMEKRDYEKVTVQEQEEIWVASKLRKIAFKDLDNPIPPTEQVTETEKVTKASVEEVPAGVAVH